MGTTVVEIDGITEEELIRAAQIARLKEYIDIAPPIAPHEMTARDAREQLWPHVSENTAERKLEALVKQGIMKSEDRHDSRSGKGRSAKAYWFIDGAPDL